MLAHFIVTYLSNGTTYMVRMLATSNIDAAGSAARRIVRERGVPFESLHLQTVCLESKSLIQIVE